MSFSRMGHFSLKICSLACLVGCSLGGPLRKDVKAEGYHPGTLSNDWEKQESDSPADTTYIQKKHGAVIALSSLCKRYDRVPLEQLNKDLVNPLRSHQIISEEKRMLDGREALFTRARGELDGVDVESLLVNLRKNDCIFDFSLFSRDKIYPQDEKDFMGFVEGFHYEGGL